MYALKFDVRNVRVGKMEVILHGLSQGDNGSKF